MFKHEFKYNINGTITNEIFLFFLKENYYSMCKGKWTWCFFFSLTLPCFLRINIVDSIQVFADYMFSFNWFSAGGYTSINAGAFAIFWGKLWSINRKRPWRLFIYKQTRVHHFTLRKIIHKRNKFKTSFRCLRRFTTSSGCVILWEFKRSKRDMSDFTCLT